ncbi:CRISPR-associated protein, Cmr1 family [Armatimonadetes bacterium GBS]|nr:CRISPR-associated protein, Cmr1 family [Armatimonadetes bacterium GBS]CUU38817.1 CRISPR-associated protein, Cmr1 family [Armatimonadetes bacterium GXS]
MSKRKPEVQPPEWQAPEKPAELSLEIATITPLFGGGYAARECDELIPVRSAAVRGHLRFWWRATAGARFTSVQELYEAECTIWGGPSDKNKSRVGKVRVRTEVLHPGTKKSYSQIAPKSTPKAGPRHGFFLFPFQEAKNQNIPEASGLEGVKFMLYVDYVGEVSDQQKQEVERAVKAWLIFGGIGARTRRGCGALRVVGEHKNWLLPADRDSREPFLKQLLGGSANRRDYPTLAGATIVVGEPQDDPMKVWSELGRFWARFRKGHFGNNIQYDPMSGGRWGDYRGVLCQLRNVHNTVSLAKPFLGLPIIYQKLKGTCFDGAIEPADSGRMASPVILKPVALDDGRFAPLIAVLHAQKPTQVKINSVPYTLREPDASQEPVLKALKAQNVLDGVVKAAQQHFTGTQIIHL